MWVVSSICGVNMCNVMLKSCEKERLLTSECQNERHLLVSVEEILSRAPKMSLVFSVQTTPHHQYSNQLTVFRSEVTLFCEKFLQGFDNYNCWSEQVLVTIN